MRVADKPLRIVVGAAQRARVDKSPQNDFITNLRQPVAQGETTILEIGNRPAEPRPLIPPVLLF